VTVAPCHEILAVCLIYILLPIVMTRQASRE
jgi:hypothetical protein